MAHPESQELQDAKFVRTAVSIQRGESIQVGIWALSLEML